MSDAIDTIRLIFGETAKAHLKFAEYGLAGIVDAATAIAEALAAGRKVLAFGNGGSASDAAHLVAELVGRFEGERRALAAIALTSDSAVLTAIGNDYGYERVFSRQLDALGCSGDIAFGISTSGRSRNVEIALAAAKAGQLRTIALTGCDGGSIGTAVDIHLNVTEVSTARVQEVHRTVMHAMCTLIDRHVRADTRS